MSSWFNIDSVKGSVKDLTAKATAQVQSAVKFDKEMLEKLTLTTPELTAERQRIDAEERRKEEIKGMLADLYPWETRDPERDILVEECKEAILKLSSDKETFFGPYPMPAKAVRLEEKKKKKPEGEDQEGEDTEEVEEEEKDHHRDREPSKESLEKLEKLEPLPPLLQDFDLDAHVGLIQKLLAVDPKLVEMQSHLSGGGEREKIFWHNYFFHCAFTRYEAGLSPDEIWSEDHSAPEPTTEAGAAGATATETTEEETVTFVNAQDESSKPVEEAFSGEPTTDSDAPTGKEAEVPRAPTSRSDSVSQDYEIVESEGEGDDAIEDTTGDAAEDVADYELDELEAEIARELED